MANGKAHPSRSFAILGGITFAAVLAAAFVITFENADRTSDFERRLLFPELSDRAEDVARITIETKDETFDVVRDANGRWSLPGKGGYRPALPPIRLTIQGLAALELTESKTERPELHQEIGLGAPADDGDGVLIGLYGADDDVIARVIVGNTQRRGRGSMPNVFYVRLPESNQTWLARSILEVKDEQTDWIDADIIDVARDDIRSVSVMPLDGPAYLLERESAESTDFALGVVPDGRTPKAAFNLNSTAYALAGLSITDVKPADEIDFADGARATYRLFNGLILDLDLVEGDDEHWVSFMADAEEALPAAETARDRESADGTAGESETPLAPETSIENPRDEAASVNERTEGWAFGIAEFKFDQMTKTLDSLLEPPEDESATDASEEESGAANDGP